MDGKPVTVNEVVPGLFGQLGYKYVTSPTSSSSSVTQSSPTTSYTPPSSSYSSPITSYTPPPPPPPPTSPPQSPTISYTPPTSPTPSTSTSTPKTEPLYMSYTIAKGDTLSGIAAKYGTTVQALLNANPQITNPNLIYAGNILKIPTTISSTSTNNTTNTTNTGVSNTVQKQLQQINQQAQQIAQSIASQSTSISPELQKAYQNLYGQTLTPGQIAGSVAGGTKTASSFDVISNLAKDIFSNIGGTNQPGGIQDIINQYLKTLIATPQDIQKAIQNAKSALQTGKESTIGYMKDELDRLTRGELSKLGLEAGVGSGQIEAYQSLVRRNMLAINQLAAQYDAAIANLDLQSAQAIRQELNQLLDVQLKLEQNRQNLMAQSLNVASNIYQADVQNLQGTLSSLIESSSGRKWNELDTDTQNSIIKTASKLESYLGVPRGSLISAYKNQIDNPKAAQILQYSLPNGEFGYYVLDQNGNLIKKQMVGTAVSGGLDLSTKGGKQSYASAAASDILSSYLKSSSINLIKQEAQKAVDNANKIYGTNFKVEDFIQEVKDEKGNVIDIEIKDVSNLLPKREIKSLNQIPETTHFGSTIGIIPTLEPENIRIPRAVNQIQNVINSAVNSVPYRKINPDEAFGIYNEIFTRYLNPQGISSVDEEARVSVLSQIANFVDFNATPQTNGGKILKTELLNTFNGIDYLLGVQAAQQTK
ncbi:MAG: LysM domain-containing protein [Candidatus Anstonellales archaeon]